MMMIAVFATTVAVADVGLDEHVGARVPLDLPFVDSTGERVTLRHYFDGTKPVVLVMAYARCRMLCSVVLHGASDAFSHGTNVPGRDFVPLVVSLDPDETADEAARRQALLLDRIGRPGARDAWPYAVGRDEDIHALADALGFRYAWDPRTEQYAHPAIVFVLAPDGRIAEYVRGVVFDHLDAAIDRARAGVVTTSTASDLLSCFKLDPSLSAHRAGIDLAFRIGASAVFVALLSLIVTLLVRGHRSRTWTS